MNTTHPYGERSIQLSIIISLLLHMLFVLYCITKNPVQQKTNSILNKTEAIFEHLPQKNNTEWVETKQRPSHGGAPIFFHDDDFYKLENDINSCHIYPWTGVKANIHTLAKREGAACISRRITHFRIHTVIFSERERIFNSYI